MVGQGNKCEISRINSRGACFLGGGVPLARWEGHAFLVRALEELHVKKDVDGWEMGQQCHWVRHEIQWMVRASARVVGARCKIGDGWQRGGGRGFWHDLVTLLFGGVDGRE